MNLFGIKVTNKYGGPQIDQSFSNYCVTERRSYPVTSSIDFMLPVVYGATIYPPEAGVISNPKEFLSFNKYQGSFPSATNIRPRRLFVRPFIDNPLCNLGGPHYYEFWDNADQTYILPSPSQNPTKTTVYSSRTILGVAYCIHGTSPPWWYTNRGYPNANTGFDILFCNPIDEVYIKPKSKYRILGTNFSVNSGWGLNVFKGNSAESTFIFSDEETSSFISLPKNVAFTSNAEELLTITDVIYVPPVASKTIYTINLPPIPYRRYIDMEPFLNGSGFRFRFVNNNTVQVSAGLPANQTGWEAYTGTHYGQYLLFAKYKEELA